MADDFNIIIDFGDVSNLAEDIQAKVQEALDRSAKFLAINAHAHMVELAGQRLKDSSRQEQYIKGLQFKQLDQSTWEIVVPEAILWIEEGRPQGSMVESFLKSDKAKVSKDGNKYLVIPFQHSKAPTRQSAAQNELLNQVKQALRDNKISYKGIEKNTDGSPKTGLLHKLNINSPQKGKDSGIPYLQGVNVYQRPVKNPDGSPKFDNKGFQKVSRDVMTFRTVSQKDIGSGKWMYPGIEGVKLLDETAQWIETIWDRDIKPELMRQLKL